MDKNINFPHLGIYLENVGKSIDIRGFSIAYYGIIIACGMLLGLMAACARAKETRQKPDDYTDLFIYMMIFGVIGARIYYVIFQFDYYRNNLISIFNLRQGGLAIYGGIIGGVLTILVFSRLRRMKVARVLDTVAMGVLIGQILGRWGNFFNREAFGGYTDGLLAMQLPVSAVRSGEITQQMMENLVETGGVTYVQVHPTFLYESLWNLGVLAIVYLTRNKTKFEGELFMRYLIGYGIGRFWIEALRTDQLLIPGTAFPVSQGLSAVIVLGCAALTVILRSKKKKKETA